MLNFVPRIFAFWDNDFMADFDLDSFGSQKFKTPEQEFLALQVSHAMICSTRLSFFIKRLWPKWCTISLLQKKLWHLLLQFFYVIQRAVELDGDWHRGVTSLLPAMVLDMTGDLCNGGRPVPVAPALLGSAAAATHFSPNKKSSSYRYCWHILN